MPATKKAAERRHPVFSFQLLTLASRQVLLGSAPGRRIEGSTTSTVETNRPLDRGHELAQPAAAVEASWIPGTKESGTLLWMDVAWKMDVVAP